LELKRTSKTHWSFNFMGIYDVFKGNSHHPSPNSKQQIILYKNMCRFHFIYLIQNYRCGNIRFHNTSSWYLEIFLWVGIWSHDQHQYSNRKANWTDGILWAIGRLDKSCLMIETTNILKYQYSNNFNSFISSMNNSTVSNNKSDYEEIVSKNRYGIRNL